MGKEKKNSNYQETKTKIPSDSFVNIQRKILILYESTFPKYRILIT